MERLIALDHGRGARRSGRGDHAASVYPNWFIDRLGDEALQKALAAWSRTGMDRSGRAFREAPCRLSPRDDPAERAFRTDIPYGACLSPRNQTCSECLLMSARMADPFLFRRQESKKPLASSPARGFWKRLACKRRALQAGCRDQRVSCLVSITLFRGISCFLREKRFGPNDRARILLARIRLVNIFFLTFDFSSSRMRAHLHMNTMQRDCFLSDAQPETAIA